MKTLIFDNPEAPIESEPRPRPRPLAGVEPTRIASSSADRFS